MLYVALETEFILALTMGEDFALGTIDLIGSARGFPLVPPAVIAELEWQAVNLPEEAFREVASKALAQLPNYHFLTPSLSPTQRDVSEITAKKLVSAGVYECAHSALIVSEAAALGCRVLLTYSPRTTSLEALQALKLNLLAADLIDCMPLPPDAFVKALTPPSPEGPKPA